MALTAISPNQVREQSKSTKYGALSGVDFSTVSAAVGGVAATGAGVATNNYTPAAVTSVAASAISGVPSSMGGASSAPYLTGTPMMGTASTPFSTGGYGYSGATFAGGYNGYSGSVGVPGASPVSGITGAPSQDFQEKQYLFQEMNDSNWQMLTAQITVNELSKNYQASSNILKTKSDTELNAVRNMRA